MKRILIITVFLLIVSLAASVSGFGTISVWTDRPVYYVGELVRVSFDTMGGGIPASVIIEITGPVSLTLGPTNIVTGGVRTITMNGATFFPGYYTVKVSLILELDIYEGLTYYTVLPADIVTESLTIFRTRTKTEVETLYTYTTRYVTRSSKVTVTDTLTKTGKTMSTTITITGIVTVTTCSPTVTETRTISTMLAQRLSAISPLVVLSIITLNILYRRESPHKKGVS